jgi:hypothetical protein
MAMPADHPAEEEKAEAEAPKKEASASPTTRTKVAKVATKKVKRKATRNCKRVDSTAQKEVVKAEGNANSDTRNP